MKPHQPKIKYLSPSPHGHVLVDEATWQAPMRLTRCGHDPVQGPTLSYGQYFEGITDIISRDGYGLIADAAARKLEKDVSLNDIKEVLIRSEKHGSDYHPARIEVIVNDLCATFVMNVAITARGKSWLCRKFEALQYLNSKHDFPFLPRTYFHNEASPPSMLMFLADWFRGYHEFHLTIDKGDGSLRVLLWDAEKGPCFLSRPQAWQIYSQAAMILTLYYDIETFEQIFPWHHAAGDFVVKTQYPHPNPPPSTGRAGWGSTASPDADDGNYETRCVDVRLVTARQYASMLERSEGLSVPEALLFFLLNLSIRMRLDRLDGIGSIAWADDDCVNPTVEGFVAGLRTKERQGIIETGFVDGFLSYLRSLAIKDLSDGFHALVDACDQAAPDIPVVRRHLKRHISKFHSALQSLEDS